MSSLLQVASEIPYHQPCNSFGFGGQNHMAAASHRLRVLMLVLLSYMALVGSAWPYAIKQKEVEKHAGLERQVISFPSSEFMSCECTLGRRLTASTTACRQLVPLDCKIIDRARKAFEQYPLDKKISLLLNSQSPISIDLKNSLGNCWIREHKPINMKIWRTKLRNEGARSLVVFCSDSLSAYRVPALRSSPCSLVYPRNVSRISPPRYAAAQKFGILVCLDPPRELARRSVLSSKKAAGQSNSYKLETPKTPLPNSSTASTDNKSSSTESLSLVPPDPPQPNGAHP